MKTWRDIINATNAQIITWAEKQSWAAAMAACGQDSKWHAEGDVWTHTKMVWDEVAKLAEYRALDRLSQLKLLFTALLHDCGKPATTEIDPDSGRTRSPKHSIVGAALARKVLRDLQVDLNTREEIVHLVRYHGRPPYLLEKGHEVQEVISLSWLLNNRLLYLFSIADTRGRKAEETSRPEEKLHFWKIIAEENQCFERAYSFANDHARFLFYRKELSSLHYIPREDYKCTATLMSGLPGSGKDTWLQKHKPGLPVVALDQIREDLDIDATENQGKVIQAAREEVRGHLRAGRDFAFNATNTMQQTRKRWIDLFADYGARIEIVYIEPTISNILERNRRREQRVPEKVIHHLLEKLEPPQITECHGLTLVGEV
ncbi:AAA family ATPase [Pedosphaera parvula]|uniref:Metal dependent phosphohydrolase n=1 Tax=Pedosphaera parvula (strain Ellin514) TaxID=320771 RepID=B9XDP8_PEDPL|nr:AAA family ATPase [Pedosphaera parvula]EEF62194.1 metal dependent phosphohydrolase [Pedosphaera parvula Ellin514]